jgi:hypothetical protein
MSKNDMSLRSREKRVLHEGPAACRGGSMRGMRWRSMRKLDQETAA